MRTVFIVCAALCTAAQNSVTAGGWSQPLTWSQPRAWRAGRRFGGNTFTRGGWSQPLTWSQPPAPSVGTPTGGSTVTTGGRIVAGVGNRVSGGSGARVVIGSGNTVDVESGTVRVVGSVNTVTVTEGNTNVSGSSNKVTVVRGNTDLVGSSNVVTVDMGDTSITGSSNTVDVSSSGITIGGSSIRVASRGDVPADTTVLTATLSTSEMSEATVELPFPAGHVLAMTISEPQQANMRGTRDTARVDMRVAGSAVSADVEAGSEWSVEVTQPNGARSVLVRYGRGAVGTVAVTVNFEQDVTFTVNRGALP